MYYISEGDIESLIREDLQLMDLTTLSMGIEDVPGYLECFPKRDCVVAGVEEAARVLAKMGAVPQIVMPSGTCAGAGEICLKAHGTAGVLHSCYKLAQNIMEYSSGIATRTADMLRNARTVNPLVHVAVTRKHFPGTKALSIKAAIAGGATVHRLGLSDSILSFDQHRIFADGFLTLIPVMAHKFPEKKIGAEAGSPDEALLYVRAGAHFIQCERFGFSELGAFVKEARSINPSVVIAAAGGVNAANAGEYTAAGVDVLVTSWVYFGKPEDIKMRMARKI